MFKQYICTCRNDGSRRKRKQNSPNRALKLLFSFTTCAITMLLSTQQAFAFSPTTHLSNQMFCGPIKDISIPFYHYSSSDTALNVWFFGGSNGNDDGDDSCELVAVRIDRTSPNSRRISGDIIVPRHLDDVWAILTDYDNLAIHVPNLVESRRVNPSNGNGFDSSSTQGDGKYRCRLYQRGAQKIVGFDFSASVTMDMTERIIGGAPFVPSASLPSEVSSNEQRQILFKCVDSKFFSEFDGEWRISWCADPDDRNKVATKVSYVVDVRPRGPVPVQALEWRIREDVPTNLRAVKLAAMEVGKEGVLALRDRQRLGRGGKSSNIDDNTTRTSTAMIKQGNPSQFRPSSSLKTGSDRFQTLANNTRRNMGNAVRDAAKATAQMTSARPRPKLAPVRVQWYEDETMASYLKKKKKLN